MSKKNDYGRVVTPDSSLGIACKKCGHVVQAFANHCPQCGSPVREQKDGCMSTIKQLFGLLCTIAVIWTGYDFYKEWSRQNSVAKAAVVGTVQYRSNVAHAKDGCGLMTFRSFRRINEGSELQLLDNNLYHEPTIPRERLNTPPTGVGLRISMPKAIRVKVLTGNLSGSKGWVNPERTTFE